MEHNPRFPKKYTMEQRRDIIRQVKNNVSRLAGEIAASLIPDEIGDGVVGDKKPNKNKCDCIICEGWIEKTIKGRVHVIFNLEKDKWAFLKKYHGIVIQGPLNEGDV